MSDRAGAAGPWADQTEVSAFFGAGAGDGAEEVSAEVAEAIDAYVAAHPGGRERLIPLLHHIQERIGYLPFAVQEAIAAPLGLSPMQVYEVVSFYHFFTTTPRGRYQLKVCMGTACFVQHADRLLDTIHDLLGLEIGGVTEDRLFSLEQVRCIGACGLAPAMMVNSEVHGHLDATALRKLIRRLKAEARQQDAGQEAAHV